MGNTQQAQVELPRVEDMSVDGKRLWLGLYEEVGKCSYQSGDASAAYEERVKGDLDVQSAEHPELCVAVHCWKGSLMHKAARYAKTESLVRHVWECCGESALQIMRLRTSEGFTALLCLAHNPNMTRGMYAVFAQHCTEDDLRAVDNKNLTALFHMALILIQPGLQEEQEDNIASVMYAVAQRLGPSALLVKTTKNYAFRGKNYPTGATLRSILRDAGGKGHALLQRLEGSASFLRQLEEADEAHDIADEAHERADQAHEMAAHTAPAVPQKQQPAPAVCSPPADLSSNVTKTQTPLLKEAEETLRLAKVVPGLRGAADLVIDIMTCVEDAADTVEAAEEIMAQLQLISDALVEIRKRVRPAEGEALHRFALTKVARVMSDLEDLAAEIEGVRGGNLLRLFRGGKIRSLLRSMEDNLQQALSWSTAAFMVAQADGSGSVESKAGTADEITEPSVLLEQEHIAQMRFPVDALQHDHTRWLGSGGFTQVYAGMLRASDNTGATPSVAEHVAIKIIPALALPELRAGLLEMERQSKLTHKNVVSLYGFAVTEAALDASSADGQLLMAMELAELGDLHDVIELPSVADATGRVATPDTALTAELRAGFLLQAAEAIDYVHSHGLVHRDIESHNCVIFRDLTLKLTDFGISRKLTIRGESAFYMAPEMDESFHGTYDHRVDVYSFGVMAGEVLTRSIPRRRLGRAPALPTDMVHAAVEDAALARGAPRFAGGGAAVPAPAAEVAADPNAHLYEDSEPDAAATADPDDECAEDVQRRLWDCMFHIHRDCVEQAPRDRPEMSEILSRLRRCLRSCVAVSSNPAAERLRECRLRAVAVRRGEGGAARREAVGAEQS